MRKTKPKGPQERVTRGFTVDEDGQGDGQEAPRRVRTRQQIINGEGKRPPATVELKLLAHNPFNPREELTALDETAASLREKGQIQPVTVVRRAAFLTVHQGQEEALGDAEYVVLDGNRRLAAARLAGMEELRIDVNDVLAASAADILESALIANIHRVDVDAMDQARAIQELLDAHGQQKIVAQRLGKSAAWVSQRLALLKLPEDLQEKVESGELKVKDGRRIGSLPVDQQRAEAEEAINRVKPPRKPRGSAAEGSSVGLPAPASSGVVVADPAVPAQPAGSSSSDAARPAVNPVNRDAGLPDPVAAFNERYAERAVAFAAEMQGIAAAYREAAAVDEAAAADLVEKLKERLNRVMRHLP
ncbi:ParB/RepB/Spo0J family partition protein [Streptomyces sp. NPDC002215]|uniref:ParB/RepB/Spo0J family partition protein n=1 Tax=Streptomyces sp. NPDC002215 TaxID=3154412 RepID=UPI00332222AE